MLLLGNYRWYSQTSGNTTGGIGSVEELRISDCARWTANFTVPSAAYTSDENTLLLMHFGFQVMAMEHGMELTRLGGGDLNGRNLVEICGTGSIGTFQLAVVD